MAIEGVISAVNSAVANSAVSTIKPKTGTDVKDVGVQSAQQTAPSAGVAAKSKVHQEESVNTLNGEEKEADGQMKPSDSTLKQLVSDMNRKINNNTVAEFGYHEDTNRVTIKIVDKDTKEVLKEFPPEKTLDLIAKAWELAGINIDEKK